MKAMPMPTPTPMHHATRSRGFTLIEVMIVVAIVGILAAIAYPSYLEHIRKSRRSEAKTALLDLAARQERFFSTQSKYSKTPADLNYGASSTFPLAVLGGGTAYYQLDVTDLSSTSYTATATPIGSQAGDRCGTFQLDALGTQTLVDAVQAPTECW